MWFSIVYMWRILCSVMAENHQLHGHVLASKVLLCLHAATCTASYIDPWLWREGKEEESPPETKLAVKAVSLLGPV